MHAVRTVDPLIIDAGLLATVDDARLRDGWVTA
jgi:hypothetical protein